MKILLLTDGVFPYVMGGMQKHSYNLVKYLTSGNNQVTLMHCVSMDSNCPSSQEVQKEIFGLENDNLDIICTQFPKPGKLPGHYLRNSKKLSAKYWELIYPVIGEYDFVYSQGFTAWEFLKNKKKSPKIGIHFHGYNSFQSSFGLKQKLEALLLNREIRSYAAKADYLFSLGGDMTNLISTNVPFPAKKILPSWNGIEEHWLSHTNKNFTSLRKFVFVGRPNKIKAIDLIYLSIKSLKENAEFHFVGDFPENKKLNLPNVKYWGEIKNEGDLRAIYNESDILLCPSYSEGLPTVILEAMALGLPVIASNVGAINEVLKDKVNGLLIPSGSKEEILKALLYYCNLDLKTLQKQSESARKTISGKFLWKNVINKTLEGIQGVVNQN